MHEFSILGSAYCTEKNLDSRVHGSSKELTRQSKFMNNQYIQYLLKRSLKPFESISAFRFVVKNINRGFTMFWFPTNCKLCLTHGHDFLKTLRNRQWEILVFHLNLLSCRCRNTKRFSASLNNCLGKLVEIAITDQNAWAFGDESLRIWILCNTSLAWQRLHLVLVFAPKGSQRWKRRSATVS